MKRFLLFATAAAMMLMMLPVGVQADESSAAPPPLQAEQAVENDAAKKIELKTIRLINGTASLQVGDKTYAAAGVKTLPKDVAYVARQFPDASYASDGRTLVIGINERGQARNAVLAEIAWQSDCPDNSQYRARSEPAVLADATRRRLHESLVAWTRWRHDSLQAQLRRMRRSSNRHWDVQLDLKLVSLR